MSDTPRPGHAPVSEANPEGDRALGYGNLDSRPEGQGEAGRGSRPVPAVERRGEAGDAAAQRGGGSPANPDAARGS